MKKFIGKNKTFLLYANLDGSIDISNNLIYMVNFLTRVPDCDSKRPALLDWFISSDASICSTMAFLSLRNSNNVVVTVSIDFPSNPKRDAFFHHKTYDYFLADLDCRRDLGDVPWKPPSLTNALTSKVC